MSELVKYVRFKDLSKMGIVSNWTTLRRWIKAGHFPSGQMIGPNSRAWTEYEVAEFQTRLSGVPSHLSEEPERNSSVSVLEEGTRKL